MNIAVQAIVALALSLGAVLTATSAFSGGNAPGVQVGSSTSAEVNAALQTATSAHEASQAGSASLTDGVSAGL